MKRALLPWVLVAGLAGCASAPPPRSYVVLVESPDGSTGRVVVSDAGGRRVLERAGQGTLIGDPAGATFDVDDARRSRDFGGVRLVAESQRRMVELAARIRAWPAVELLVVGHTDTVGDGPFNERLGLARAQAVAAELASRGVNPLSLDLESRGERELLVDTPDETDEPRNRRVVVSVR
jgi:outer membrane protein OmpA-like peptidoglycan-associated protein